MIKIHFSHISELVEMEFSVISYLIFEIYSKLINNSVFSFFNEERGVIRRRDGKERKGEIKIYVRLVDV